MASLMTYTMMDSDLQNFANNVKDAIAQQLECPELNNYLVIVGRPSLWGQFKSKITGKDPKNPDDLRILLVKPALEDKNKE